MWGVGVAVGGCGVGGLAERAPEVGGWKSNTSGRVHDAGDVFQMVGVGAGAGVGVWVWVRGLAVPADVLGEEDEEADADVLLQLPVVLQALQHRPKELPNAGL